MAYKAVLVTGAHGFLGRNVARRFAEAGYLVTGMGHGVWDRHETEAFGLTFWHTTDITLDALVTYAGKPAVIVHCAGSGSVPYSIEQPHQDFQRTVSNTAAVLEYVRVHSPTSIVVYPSSAAVYGTVTKVPIEELDPLLPVSPYGVHKLMAEQLCQSYAKHFGLSVAVVRFFSIYGKGLRKQLLWDACRKVSDGDRGFHGTGLEVRDWVHVDDAAALLMAVAREASPECPVFNGGSGVGTQIADLLGLVFAELQPQGSAAFNGVGRNGDPSRFIADSRRATAIGWSPKTVLESGVADYVAWFKGLR